MIYEMRSYEHADGLAQAVRERFKAEVAPRLPKHNIELVAVFVDCGNERLTYLTRFQDEAARAEAWKSFGSDAGWLAAKVASEVNGKMVLKQHTVLLTSAMAGLPIG
jgi:hypothetical protein